MMKEILPDNSFNNVAVESGWVKLCPYLEVRPPHPMAASQDMNAKDVMEIFDFYKGENSEKPFESFMEHFKRMPVIPRAGETKLSSFLRMIRLLKIARKSGMTPYKTTRFLHKAGIET